MQHKAFKFREDILNLGGIVLAQITKKYDIKRVNKSKISENPEVILESDKPLSQSMLWKLQADFYANQGPVLDCATFDMTQDEEIRLKCSGEVLSEGDLKNPLILFANYTFDSLPQDTFYVNKGELFEGLITITSKGEQVDSEDKSILADLDYYYTDKQIQGSGYYEETKINDILLYYKDCLEDTAFSLPIVAFRCINRLKKLSGDDIILISADKGYRNASSMHKNYHPYLSKHGSISLTVNFHALELYFKSLGGKAIHSIYEHENVTMSLFLQVRGHIIL